MPTKNKDNLIHFPKIHSNPPIDENSVSERIREYKDSYSTELAEIIWENVLGEMARAGCEFDEDFEAYFPSMILILAICRRFVPNFRWMVSLPVNFAPIAAAGW